MPKHTRPLTIEHLEPRLLTPEGLDEIWAFISRFVRRSRTVFETALLAADELTLGRDDAGRIRAFVALRFFTVEWGGRPCTIIHTPWTAIDAEFRGQNITQQEGLRSYLRARWRHPTRPSYWVMSSSTYLSYLVLPHNFAHFWPRREEAMPAREQAIIRQVMALTGEENWDPVAGVVRRFGATRYCEGLVSQLAATRRNPDVQFYARQNPGQDEGDTLVCIVPLTAANWVAVVRNMVQRLVHRHGTAAPSRAAET